MQPVRWTLAAVVLCLSITGARGNEALRGEDPAAIAMVRVAGQINGLIGE